MKSWGFPFVTGAGAGKVSEARLAMLNGFSFLLSSSLTCMELPNLGGPSGLARLGCQVLPAGDMHSGELHVDPGSGRKLGPYRDQTLTPMPI